MIAVKLSHFYSCVSSYVTGLHNIVFRILAMSHYKSEQYPNDKITISAVISVPLTFDQSYSLSSIKQNWNLFNLIRKKSG